MSNESMKPHPEARPDWAMPVFHASGGITADHLAVPHDVTLQGRVSALEHRLHQMEGRLELQERRR